MADAPIIQQSSTQAPAQPAYVLRGHNAQIHASLFLRQNLRLLTGDAEGWVIIWCIVSKRAVAVWRAHENSILGFGCWDEDKIITHGRDNKLHVWQIREEDEAGFSTLLPIDDQVAERKQPWMLHSLNVNALNFCSFAECRDLRPEASSADSTGVLIATPGVQDGHINVTALPSASRVATIPCPKDPNTGMVMALGLHFLTPAGIDGQRDPPLLVLAGYESGHACVWQEFPKSTSATIATAAPSFSSVPRTQWQLVYISAAHSQPILSLCISTSQNAFFTSSADAIIARHEIYHQHAGTASVPSTPSRVVQTKHAGQQALQMRSDDRIFATAGWDGRARVYSSKTMKEVAVLKWHKEGCYALAFGAVREPGAEQDGAIAHASGKSSVAARRAKAAQNAHWLAVGSKDGKVSLWDIF